MVSLSRSQRSTIIFNQLSAHEVWTISPYVSATRALAIVATLEALSYHQGSYKTVELSQLHVLIYLKLGISDNIDTVRTFYTTGIGPIVGDEFQSPDLPFLARQWIKSSSTWILAYPELFSLLRQLVGHWRTASRQLFEAGIAQLSDEDATSTSDLWQKNCTRFLNFYHLYIDRISSALHAFGPRARISWMCYGAFHLRFYCSRPIHTSFHKVGVPSFDATDAC